MNMSKLAITNLLNQGQIPVGVVLFIESGGVRDVKTTIKLTINVFNLIKKTSLFISEIYVRLYVHTRLWLDLF